MHECALQNKCSENSQKFTGKPHARDSFIVKLQAGGLQLSQNRNSGTGVFLVILRNFNVLNLFYRIPPGDCIYI